MKRLAVSGVAAPGDQPIKASNPGALPRQLLSMLGEGGIASTAELARRLGVSEGLVGLMAEELARRGYLAPLDTGCSSTHCKGCHLAAACAAPGQEKAQPGMLALTPKGWQAAMA